MRVRNALRRKEAREGFTLVELLIVIAIIAILAAIAIPQFNKYKQRAYVAAMRSDAHNIIAAEEAYYAENDEYANGTYDSGNYTITIGTGNSTNTIPLTKNVVLVSGVTTESCSDGSPGYTFSLGHNNIKSGGTYKITVDYDSCNDRAPREVHH